MREIVVFSGSSHPALAEEICGWLGAPLSPAVIKRFTNDCLEVQLQANCRERDVFLIQTLGKPVQEHLVELLLMIDAARGASAARITVVMPFYAYARSDKKDAPRISIGGRLVADLLATAGASRVLTMALHSPQVHGFFSVPVDHLHALHELADALPRPLRPLQHGRGRRPTWATPSRRRRSRAGSACRSRSAPSSGISDTKVVISAIIGETAGKDVIVHRRRDRRRLDGDRAAGAPAGRAASATVRIACTHGLFGRGALERLADEPEVVEIVTMNTVPIAPGERVSTSSPCSRSPRRSPKRCAASTKASRSANCSTTRGLACPELHQALRSLASGSERPATGDRRRRRISQASAPIRIPVAAGPETRRVAERRQDVGRGDRDAGGEEREVTRRATSPPPCAPAGPDQRRRAGPAG